MKRAFALTLGLGLTWSGTASAQDMSWSTITPSITGTDVLGLHLREQIQRQRSAPRAEGAAGGRNALVAEASAPTLDLRALRYTPSKSRRAANLARFVERSRAADPAGAAQLQQLFASGDFIEKIGHALAPHGMRVDNVADAYTVWWINAWQATRGRNDSSPRAINEAVRAQAGRALSASPQFVGATDAAKQELAESLLVQAAMIDAAVERSKGDAALLRRIGGAVNQGARRMGVDLTTMQLTEQGFVPATSGSTHAAPAPAPGDPGEAVASSVKTDNLRYAPIALAALGGVGGLIWWRRGRG